MRTVRLDLFLKKVRLIKSRSQSNDMCKTGKVTLNDKQAKPGKMVKPHDTIRIDFGKRMLVAKILKIPQGNVKKSESSDYYTIISDEKVDVRS